MTHARTFRLAVLTVSLTLALLTGAVIVRGEQLPLLVSHDPADRAQDVPVRASLRFVFRRPVDVESVRASLTVSELFGAPVEGTIERSGRIVTFTPDRALEPGTWYLTTLRPGIRDAAGRVTEEEQSLAFRTRPSRLLIRRPEGDASGRPGTENLWVIDPASGQPARRLTQARGSVAFATAAPDGDQVAYGIAAEQDPDRATLWIVGVVNGTERQIWADPNATVTGAAWSPRGDLIVVERRQRLPGAPAGAPVLGPAQLWAISPTGTVIGPLYAGGDKEAFEPVFAPDGNKLAFVEPRREAIGVSNLTRDPIFIPSRGYDAGSWSPAGDRLVYADLEIPSEPDRTALFVATFDGAPPVRRSGDGASDRLPAWSPNGALVAFVRREAGGWNGIWIARPDGTEARPLARDRSPRYTRPAWSPDGRQLAFGRTVEVGRRTGELWLARLDGTSRRLDDRGEIVGWLP